EIVFDVMANADDQANIHEQAAAWHLLGQLTDRERLLMLLAKAPGRTPLVVDLQAAARDLHALPSGREGVLRLSYLRDPARADLWQTFKTQADRLGVEQRQGLELRHLPVLAALDDATARAS